MKKIVVEIGCPFCGSKHTVTVNESAFYAWQDGALIQKVMPELSATEREQLISHICPSCQIKMFGEEE